MDVILETRNLTKQFNDKTVLKDVNLTLKRGEIYGLLGRNGSGKTTTLRMILGLITPTSGEIRLFGKPIGKKNRPPFERIGNMIEPTLYENLTVAENLGIHAKLMGYADKLRIEEVLSDVDLLDDANTRCKKLSLGIRQRVCIARALLHKPELLILDEPMNAVDPSGTKKIREVLVRLAQKYNTAVLMSTHLLSELELMATKIGIIHQGVLIEEMDYASIQNKNKEYLELRVHPVQKAMYLLETELGIKDYEVIEEDRIRIFEQIEDSDRINLLLIKNEIKVIESKLSEDKLESYFLKLIGGDTDV